MTTTTFIIFGHAGGHPKYRENTNKVYNGRNVDPSDCCVYCGKYATSTKTYVYLTGYGEIIENPGDAAGNDDLGFYPVGSDCAKRALKAGFPVYDAEFRRVGA